MGFVLTRFSSRGRIAGLGHVDPTAFVNTSRLINTDLTQACLSRHSSEMMDRIAKGPEDVKKSVRAADELP
jgi:hypothetical protein